MTTPPTPPTEDDNIPPITPCAVCGATNGTNLINIGDNPANLIRITLCPNCNHTYGPVIKKPLSLLPPPTPTTQNVLANSYHQAFKDQVIVILETYKRLNLNPSYRKISDELNRLKFTTSRGNRFTGTTVYQLMVNLEISRDDYLPTIPIPPLVQNITPITPIQSPPPNQNIAPPTIPPNAHDLAQQLANTQEEEYNQRHDQNPYQNTLSPTCDTDDHL